MIKKILCCTTLPPSKNNNDDEINSCFNYLKAKKKRLLVLFTKY